MASFPDELVLAGTTAYPSLAVGLRVNRRAKHIYLKVEPNGLPVLILPAQRHLRDAKQFLQDKEIWLRAKLAQLPAPIIFCDGAIIPISGSDYEIVHRPDARRGVWIDADTICVSGDEIHLPRRLTDWLRRQAKQEFLRQAQQNIAIVGGELGRITVRDTKTRWGSCSAKGDLSFSWRLILAPPEILRYVVAHECAHLIEHNHSHRFWKIVRQLHPNFKAAETWLKTKGAHLHRFGA